MRCVVSETVSSTCNPQPPLAAPWVGMLQDGAWLRHAAHANRMAALLHDSARVLPGVKLLFPPQANAVFLGLSKPVIDGLLARGWLFYTFIGEGGCRFMCSWDTTGEDVRNLVKDLRELLRG